MVSLEVVGPDRVFVEGDMMRNIVILGIYITLKLIEDQRIFECCFDFG